MSIVVSHLARFLSIALRGFYAGKLRSAATSNRQAMVGTRVSLGSSQKSKNDG
jgi:hypothetical protein